MSVSIDRVDRNVPKSSSFSILANKFYLKKFTGRNMLHPAGRFIKFSIFKIYIFISAVNFVKKSFVM